MTLREFLARNGGELLGLTFEHLLLVLVSTGIAILIGVPLGILLTRKPALSKPVLGFANIMQTVPSLALFGFLIPLNIYLFNVKILGGIGARTAIVALVLYSLLPIIRNTFTGISSVDPAIRDAGRGMGMTDRQLLFQVELPLAMGVIIAGVRVATVICVGTATIAAAIDAGGLGRYIFRGLRANDNLLILAGALPAALIAIGADLSSWLCGTEDSVRRRVQSKSKKLLWSGAAVLLAVLAAAYFFAAPGGKRIAVGSKDFSEQVILGEILAQAIEAKTDLQVERRFDLGGNLAHEALVAGEIDVYAEYTGTALLSILQDKPLKDPQEVYRRVAAEYAKRFGLVWTEPLGFNNTFAISGPRRRCAEIKFANRQRRGKGVGSMARRFRSGFHVARRRLSGVCPHLWISLSGDPRDGLVAHLPRSRGEAGRLDRRQLDRRVDLPLWIGATGGRSQVFSALRRRACGAPGDAGKISRAARDLETAWRHFDGG